MFSARKDSIVASILIIVAVWPVFITALSFSSGYSAAAARVIVPSKHIIEGVPWHQQLNGLSCGAGALETVFDYWGPDINQKEIMNVARSSSMGTWTPDIVRAGHFSYMSSAQGRFFPSLGPYAGFEERPLGYAAFAYVSDKFWLDELKALIAMDIPVIVLMKYNPTGGGGHYRVVIGYDDYEQLVYFVDPWGRDLNHLTNWTGVISWSYSDFQAGWNYVEYGAENPYFGVVMIPWSISLSVKGRTDQGSVITVTAIIRYPCPEPFDNTQYPAQNAVAQITLPDGVTLLDTSTTVYLGTIDADGSTTATWKVFCDTDAAGKTIMVSAWGIISGSVPEACWQGQVLSYPAYSYTDAIGGENTVSLTD